MLCRLSSRHHAARLRPSQAVPPPSSLGLPARSTVFVCVECFGPNSGRRHVARPLLSPGRPARHPPGSPSPPASRPNPRSLLPLHSLTPSKLGHRRRPSPRCPPPPLSHGPYRCSGQSQVAQINR
ncbi:hypothetical protein NL676_010804 [Syzygium grande]|nr:hypothetical protein NL676_010804 [Syzygium grande]